MGYDHHSTPIDSWEGCTKCRLHEHRRKVVVTKQMVSLPDPSIPEAPNVPRYRQTNLKPLLPQRLETVWSHFNTDPLKHILIIGEAPGEAEDAFGLPFIGTSGTIFNRICSFCNYAFLATVTNTVCCRPTHTPETTDKKNMIGRNRQPKKDEQDACVSHTIQLLLSYEFDGIVTLGEIAKDYLEDLTTNLPVLNLHHPAYIARMDYKLITIKEQARLLELWLKRLKHKEH